MKGLSTNARTASVMSPPKLWFASLRNARRHPVPTALLQGLLLWIKQILRIRAVLSLFAVRSALSLFFKELLLAAVCCRNLMHSSPQNAKSTPARITTWTVRLVTSQLSVFLKENVAQSTHVVSALALFELKLNKPLQSFNAVSLIFVYVMHYSRTETCLCPQKCWISGKWGTFPYSMFQKSLLSMVLYCLTKIPNTNSIPIFFV